MKIQKIKRLRLIIFIFVYMFTIVNSFPLIIIGVALEYRYLLGSTLLIFGGWFGLLLISLSNKFVKNLNVGSALKYGILGCSLLIFDIIFILLFYPPYMYISPYSYSHYSYYSFVFYYNIFGTVLFCVFYGMLLRYQYTLIESNDEATIRKTILDFGTKLTRLKVDEIAEITETFHKTIIEVVNNMIENQEIYARYFKSSNSVVFNQEKNIKDIDDLMTMFREWEKVKADKI